MAILSDDLKNAIDTAIKNMGETFTAHNIIDFIIARPNYRAIYEDSLIRTNLEDKAHAEQKVNQVIGKYLSTQPSDIEQYDKLKLLNIHGTESINIACYRKTKHS